MTLVDFQGTIDCSGNPNYPSADTADMWIVSVAGRIGGASGPRVDVGDEIFCLSTNGGGTHAASGDHFSIRQANVVKPVGGSTTVSPVAGDFASFADTSGQLIYSAGYHPTSTLDGDGTALPTAAALVGALVNQGPFSCSGNPNYPAAINGDVYVVSVAGKIGGSSGSTMEVGDWAVCTADNAGGTSASVGTSWTRVQNNLTKGVTGPLSATFTGQFASFADTGGQILYGAYGPEATELTEDNTTMPTCAVVWNAINALRAELT